MKLNNLNYGQQMDQQADKSKKPRFLIQSKAINITK